MIKRMSLAFALPVAAALALALSACQPADKAGAGGSVANNVDAEDPLKNLIPWPKDRSDIVTTASGLQYIVISKGDASAPAPTINDQVEVRYDGRLAADGTVFDSSYQRDSTETFPVGAVIDGWKEGLQLMRPGDQFVFYIPAALGYGEGGAGPIPPGADLIFRVKLERIVPLPAADAEAWKKAMPWPAEGTTKTASGLQYFVIGSGAGESARAEDYVSLHYEGRTDDGETFDSSFARIQPVTFPVNMLIPGWVEVLQLMKPGDHWMVRIPSELAYGKEGQGPIPPNAPLTFEIKLLDVHRVDAPAEGAEATPPQ